MRTHSIFSLGMAALLALTACGDGSPTDPDGGTQPPPSPPPPPPPPADVVYDLRVGLTRIDAEGDCDDIFTGVDGGEFSYRFQVTWPDGTTDVLDQTSDYPSPGDIVHLGSGGSTISFTITANSEVTSSVGQTVQVQFRASEWDYDLFGNNPFLDSDMSDRNASITHQFKDGAWTNVGTKSIVLGSGGCQVQADYDFIAVKL